MRIEKLQLLAYGPFRGLELDLSTPGLHVVFGRNEAGKSTTLRAIAGLLYGIDARTPDAHVHKPTDLRIGGVLSGGAGDRIAVVRRKGNTNTLLDDDGAAIDDAVISKLLGGVSAETFKNAFGLDHMTLRTGAEGLLAGQGDLGESLFDASVGGGGEVQKLLVQLTQEAESIFVPRGSSRPLNEALKSFADAQKEIREKQRLPESFATQQRALDENRAAREVEAKRRQELDARRKLIDRARRRAPLEKRRAILANERSSLDAIAKNAARIEALASRVAAYERATKDRHDLAAESDRLRDRIADAGRRAGLVLASSAVAGVATPGAGESPPANIFENIFEGPESWPSGQHSSGSNMSNLSAPGASPTASVRVDVRTEGRIHRLVNERTSLVLRLETAREALAKAERELARMNEATPAASDEDTTALAQVLDRARSHGDVEPRHAQDAARAARKRKELEARAATIGVFEGRLDELVVVRAPSSAALERLAKRALDAERMAAQKRDRLASLDTDAAAIERQVAEQSGDFAPPDVAALRAAREKRDALLLALRDDAPAKKKRGAKEQLDLLGGEEKTPSARDLDHAIRDADEIADRMIREADRVTSLARLRASEKAIAKQREDAKIDLQRVEAERVAIDEEHRALFAPAGLVPLGFAEMRAWLDRHAQIVEAHRELREREADVEEAARAIDQAKAELRAALGLADAKDKQLSDLVLLGKNRLERAEAAKRELALGARERKRIEAAIEDETAVIAKTEITFAEMREELAELVQPIGLPEDASADEVARALDATREFWKLVDERASVDARAVAADRESRAFEEDVRRLVSEIAADLESTAAAAAATTLAKRAQKAEALAVEIAANEDQLSELGTETLPDDVAEIVATPDVARQAIEDADEELAALDREIQRLDGQIGGIEQGLETMRVETGAADASARAEDALARIRTNVERFTRVKLAAVLLSREIERYREENQGPLLSRASQLFARLTLGGFIGVRAGFDDKDKPTLACVRAGGVDVPVSGLSEGTRDQLYLSLRLASLLRHAETATPMPLVLDDVLIHFDDERSRATLGVLGEVAKSMQVLFFTHHARLVDLARAAVPTDLTVHELASAKTPETSATI